MDEAYKSSFESKQGLIKWMKAFDVRNYDGENVSVATTHFKAVLKALGEHAPPEPVRIMLKGLSQASNKEFQTLCHTQTGILDTVFYKRQLLSDKTTPAQEVDEFATIVV
jgi:mRNA deadenylase 3'-5' endonuclease subunit Ccr4